MNTLQELKQRIYKHNPELLELGFGCYVSFPYGLNRTETARFLAHTTDRSKICVYIYTPAESIQISTDKLNILGHPIHLEHVLKAIQESVGINGVSYYQALRGGKIHLLNIVKVNKEINYDLSKSFDEQPSEVHEFLLSIIK